MTDLEERTVQIILFATAAFWIVAAGAASAAVLVWTILSGNAQPDVWIILGVYAGWAGSVWILYVIANRLVDTYWGGTTLE